MGVIIIHLYLTLEYLCKMGVYCRNNSYICNAYMSQALFLMTSMCYNCYSHIS